MENAKIKIQIKSVFGDVLFELEKENNTIKDTLVEAIKQKVYLYRADMQGADMQGADMRGANMSGAYMRGANMQGANMQGSNMQGANMSGANMQGANMQGAKIQGSDMRKANMQGSDMQRSNMQGANMRGANMRGANMQGADMQGSNMQRSNMQGANMRGADMRGANMYEANMYEANMYGANMSGANMQGANMQGAKMYLCCPSEGSFVGWKKSACNNIIKLQILGESKRLSANTDKCRCDRAFVLDIQNIEGNSLGLSSVKSKYDAKFIYTVGEIVQVNDFDNNRWHECSTGIHFFIDRQSAVDHNN